MPIQIKRVYEPASPEDGYRVLIDRLWPRGVSRQSASPRLTALRRRALDGTLTLVYSAHDTEHNDAVVLAEILRRGLPKTH
jgi:uncharacterized protein YeaO (DUF488 family)